MITSNNDNRSYHSLTLANGLKVLLIQDLESEKSAVSLTVNAGHFDDPLERQGLAHYLEHMLFLGTERFPEAGAFSQFTSQHGGNSNAWTGTEHSSYFFDIQNDYLEEALTQFSQFFVAPLILPSACDKERNAIDAEFKLKLKDDSRRIYQVHKETVNPLHPFAKFSVGNKDTLANQQQCISEEIRAFFETHYQAQLMTLVISSPFEHAEMKSQVALLFNEVKGDANQKKEKITVPLYLKSDLQRDICIKPHKHMQKLIISFAMPSIDQYYQDKTVSFLAHLIGYEGAGSLYATLKARGWINGLSAGGGINGSNFKDFNISIALTDEGKEQRHAIVESFFSYLSVIKSSSTEHLTALYQDKQKLMQIAFDNQEKSRVLDWVNGLSVNMHHYPEQDYIRGDYLMTGFNLARWQAVLSHLSPDNMRLVSIFPEAECDSQAKWYQTPFSNQALSPAWLDALSKINSAQDEMRIAPINPYLVEAVNLLDIEHVYQVPNNIFHSDKIDFWYKQDATFRVAKGHFYLSIDSHETVKSVAHMAMTRLFADLFMDKVAERFYPAELAGLSYQLASHQGGLTLHTSGLSANQYELASQLLEALFDISFCAKRFAEYKKQLARHWQSGNQNKPVSLLFSHLSAHLLPWNPTPLHLAQALEHITFNDFCAFSESLFDDIHCQALLHGNWHQQDADKFVSMVNHHLASAKAIDDLKRPIEMLTNTTQLNFEVAHNDNAMVLYFQAQSDAISEKVRLIFLNHLISQEYFHNMRTVKQLGYLVGSGFAPLNTRAGIAFYIQSPDTFSDILLTHTKLFLQQYHQVITDLTPQEWQQAKQALLTQIQEKDKNLRLKSQRFWLSIGNGDTQFDMQSHLETALNQLSQCQLSNYCKKIFSAEGTRLELCTLNQQTSDLKSKKA